MKTVAISFSPTAASPRSILSPGKEAVVDGKIAGLDNAIIFRLAPTRRSSI
jgi:hypothetical protein